MEKDALYKYLVSIVADEDSEKLETTGTFWSDTPEEDLAIGTEITIVLADENGNQIEATGKLARIFEVQYWVG